MSLHAVAAVDSPVVVAVDVGKAMVPLTVTDAGRRRLLGPVDFELTGRGLVGVLALVRSTPAGVDTPVKVGIDTAGHYHLPRWSRRRGQRVGRCWSLIRRMWPNSAGPRDASRSKTDALDLEAITELVLSGRGNPVTARAAVIGELSAWAAHRTRRVPDSDQEPVAGPAGPGFSRLDAGPRPTCPGQRSAGSSRRNLPTRNGTRHWERAVSSGSRPRAASWCACR